MSGVDGEIGTIDTHLWQRSSGELSKWERSPEGALKHSCWGSFEVFASTWNKWNRKWNILKGNHEGMRCGGRSLRVCSICSTG